ncbi:MAG: DNA polymerase III subunit gamma/tau [Rubrivivax sp.]|nr:DNA polymerase III subunit gamma/tau [Rubrivivax sp.]
MSTVVLARKYRPRNFAEMVGQPHVVQALTNALTQGRLHHAYLFTGTRGIGKTTVSRILAKSLNCTGPDGTGGVTATPCGVCQACTEIDADRYIDYIELDAASNRSIDEVRDLIERAAYKPAVGRYKVFMIDEAHQLTKDAFNALLKTLEEPPEYLKFVLATTDPEKMLPTVLSRCLQFNLRPMAPATVREHLQQVLQAEGVAFDDGALRLLARAARGSMRDGLSLTDQAIAYGGGALAESGVRAMLGSVDRGHARRIVEALAARDGAALLAVVDDLRGLALSAAGTLEALALLLQQMAVEQAVPGALDVQDPDSGDARALAGVLAADETQLLYGMALHGRAELALMADDYAALTMVLLRFLAFPSTDAKPAARAPAAPLRAAAPCAVGAAGDAPAHRAGEPAPPADAARTPLPAAVAAAPVAAPAPVASPSTAPATTTTTTTLPVAANEPGAQVRPRLTALAGGALAPAGDERHPAVPVPPALGDRWAALVGRLADSGQLGALVRELAAQSGLRAIDETAEPPRWHLVVEREMLRAVALRDRLQALLAAETGAPLQLELEPGVPADSPARRDAAERQRRQAEAEAAIHRDPVVRELLAQFATARIVPGSIKPV